VSKPPGAPLTTFGSSVIGKVAVFSSGVIGRSLLSQGVVASNVVGFAPGESVDIFFALAFRVFKLRALRNAVVLLSIEKSRKLLCLLSGNVFAEEEASATGC
jgi:hypothetical protein